MMLMFPSQYDIYKSICEARHCVLLEVCAYILVAMQVAFGFTSPIPWDKAPNQFGQKTFAVDPSGCVVEEDDWRATIACVGSQLLMLAMRQGLIELGDLKGLALGEPFTLRSLVKKRDPVEADRMKHRCVHVPVIKRS